MSFRNGDLVTLTSEVYGSATKGYLHLPDVYCSGPTVAGYWEVQTTHGGYGVHTLRVDSGKLFRTEGRLS